VLAAVTYGIASALRARGYHALAWTAAQECERAAAQVDGVAAVATAAFSKGQIMLSRPGALPAALDTTIGTAEQIAGAVRTVGEVETYGMLHLHGSMVAATLGGDPEPHLAEAAAQADRLAGLDGMQRRGLDRPPKLHNDPVGIPPTFDDFWQFIFGEPLLQRPHFN